MENERLRETARLAFFFASPRHFHNMYLKPVLLKALKTPEMIIWAYKARKL